MLIKNIKVLGFSEATLTMILDILETNNCFPLISVVNNLNIKPKKEYLNKNFNLIEDNNIDKTDSLILGATNVKTKLSVIKTFHNIDKQKFIKLVSVKSDISTTTNLGDGIIINNMVCIAGQSNIGDFVFINRGVTIGHHVSIGDFTTINPGVNIAGNVKIGKNCQIGMGCNIFDGVEIGDNVTIGAGSLVTKNIPTNVLAYGTPCKIVKDFIL